MDQNIGKKLDGRYELLELIGVGGMADIYKAKDLSEEKIVAVKILKNEFLGSEDFLRRFRNESKAIALLSHPNIVRIFDVGFTDKIQFIVMEYIDGITLTEYIERQGVLKWRDALHFVTQILRALQHAHDRGIVHRDIKSQNVMLLPDGTIKVMDFGIARFNRETNKTISEKAIGSVHYISPEQARGEMTDEKSDIYSVGVMLYEMLTGKKPFDGDNPVSIALMHMQTQPKKPTEINNSIPEGLEEITLKCMQKDPAKRYQTAGELISDIEEFKKNPSIVFEYKYFPNDTTKYFDKPTTKDSIVKKDKRNLVETFEDDEELDTDDFEEDDEDYIEQRRSPLIAIMLAVASVFVVVTAVTVMLILKDAFSFAGGGSGNDTILVPQMVGMMWDDVIAQYPDLNITSVQEYSPTYPKGYVMEQSVLVNKSIKKSQQIELKVSLGSKMVELEDYTNRHYKDVTTSLRNLNLKVNEVYIEDDNIPEDFVISTDPGPRTSVPEGSEVTVRISLGSGNTMTNVPDMVNLTEASARARAKEYQISVSVLYEYSKTVEEGIVISQDIPPKTPVDKNTLVTITVSKGEMPETDFTIPLRLKQTSTVSGQFRFEYYKNGQLLPELTVVRDVGIDRDFTWTVRGTETTHYSIIITYIPTGESRYLFDGKVDFEKGEVVGGFDSAVNSSAFSDLIARSPHSTPTTTSQTELTFTDTDPFFHYEG